MPAAAEDVASITATEATVAGSSVAATEAEEDAASFSTGGDNVGKGKVILTKEGSLDISIPATPKEDEEEEEEEEEFAAPMHLHALRTPAKLKGARSRSSSRSRPGSRRSSPSPPRGSVMGGKGGELIMPTTGISPSISVESSLDGITGDHLSVGSGGEIIDPDILLDKLGFRDLDPNATQEEMQKMLRQHLMTTGRLSSVNERMSEESMDDVHAFQDLQFVKKGSASSRDELEPGGTGGGGDSPKNRRDLLNNDKGLSSSSIMASTSLLLNTLDEEIEEEGEEEDACVLEIPDGMVPKGGGPKKRRDTANAVAPGAFDESDEESEGDEDDETGNSPSPASSFGLGDEEEDAEVVVPLSVMEELKKGGPSRSRARSTVCTSAAQASASSIDDDEVDDEDAEVEVPTSVMEELKVSDGRRELKHLETSGAVAGSRPDFLEDDEQDGLAADLSDDDKHI